MASEKQTQRDNVQESIANAAEQLSDMSKDDLAAVARGLVESGLDIEKLERLSKLARKASGEALNAPMEYHY
ncbi:MAG: hypothetical protein AB7J32_08595 [Pseudonocardia sp.]